MSIHTDEKLYKCDIHKKQFIVAMRRRHSMLIHTGDKRHKCNICEKQFAQSRNLSQHIQSHIQERTYTRVASLRKTLIGLETLRGTYSYMADFRIGRTKRDNIIIMNSLSYRGFILLLNCIRVGGGCGLQGKL